MFDATKDDLSKILERAAAGQIQLPEFQREYVWDDDDVRSLLASIIQGFPIGAILTLEAGGEINFKPRPLEGCVAGRAAVEEFLLDGQQRMTSLNQALTSKKPVETLTKRGKRVSRYYYVDIEKALSGIDMDEAIVGVPADRVIRRNFGKDIVLDLSTQQKEFENRMFPLNQILDSRDWGNDWREYGKVQGQTDVDEVEREFYQRFIRRVERYQVPIIKLNRSNGRAAICQVFEKVNVGGKKLDAFELVTAIYAGDDFDLRADWLGSGENALGRKKRIAGEHNERPVVSAIASTDFLQACTVLHTRERRIASEKAGATGKELPAISCKRDALLQLPLNAYKASADRVEAGFHETSKFLNERKIFQHRDVPYPPQMVTLSSVFAILGNEGLNDNVRQKLDRWFWCTTFGELYGSASESRIAFDVPELIEWCRGGEALPRSVEDAYFQKSRLFGLRTRQSAAYKGLHALLMSRGCLDFVSARPAEIATFFDDQLDIHHIFPQDWCKKQGIDPKVFNSAVNKTPLSKRTNVRVGGDAPSVYLERIQEKDGIAPDRLDELLDTHLIDAALLRQDDFEGFMAKRADRLAAIISEAMGKPVVEEEGSDEPEEDINAPDEAIIEEIA